jgi:hypothetical protein
MRNLDGDLTMRSPWFLAGVGLALLGCSSNGNSAAPSDAAVSADSTRTGGDASCVSAAGCDADVGSPISDARALGDGDSGDLDAGLPPEDCTGLTYCDDFEAYDAALLKRGQMLGPWSVFAGRDASVTVDTVRAYTGKKSFHVVFPPTQSGGNLTQTAKPDAALIAGNDLFGRGMFYFVENPGANDAGLEPDAGVGLPIKVHSELFATSGMVTALDASTVSDIAATGRDLFLNYFPPDHFELAVFGGTLTGNAWHCLQWEFDGSGDAASNEAHVWLDGQLVITATPSKLWAAATPWKTFSFGFWVDQPEANSIDVSLDTFALSDKMLPCP